MVLSSTAETLLIINEADLWHYLKIVSGIVLPDDKPKNQPAFPHSSGGSQSGFGSVQVVPPDHHGHEGNGGGEEIGQVFDVTVTAQQNYGGQATVQPFQIPGRNLTFKMTLEVEPAIDLCYLDYYHSGPY